MSDSDAVIQPAPPPTSRWRRHAGTAALFLAVIVGAQWWQTRGLAEGAAPPLAGLRNDGMAVDLAEKVSHGEAARGEPTLVVFWATWCPVCKAEEGNIEAVAADWPVMSVAMQSGDAAVVSAHLQSRGLAVPALLDAGGSRALAWGVRGVPTHFVVDGTGRIRFRLVGYATTWGLKARLWWAKWLAA